MNVNMTKFIATFADGTTITRNSEHAYTVAWRSSWTLASGRTHTVTGFAKNQKSANPIAPYAPTAPLIHRGSSSNNRAMVKRMNDAYRAEVAYKVEFVPAVVAK
jgi:hypothetical protein